MTKGINWLVIAHCMNMDGQAASHHVSDKLPYLKSMGIQPVLLSAASGSRDPTFEHHQIFSPAPSGLRFEMRHYLRRKIKGKVWSEAIVALTTLTLLPLILLEKIFLQLDSQWSWFITAYWKGKHLSSTHNFKVIYVLGGASSAFLAAYLISRKSKVPIIAECFDPLISKDWSRSKASYKWNAWIEGIISQKANSAVWYTTGALNDASSRHKILSRTGHVIRPGMSPPDFMGITYERCDKLKFCYFGGLSIQRSLDCFLQALNEIFKSNPSFSTFIEVHIYGGKLDESSLTEAQKLPGTVLIDHGRLEHDPYSNKSGRQRVLEEMRKADFLILLHGKGSICKLYIPSKTYEYIWSLRPTIAISPFPNELKSMLPEKEHYIADQADISDVRNKISLAIKNWIAGDVEDCVLTPTFSAEDATKKIVKLALVN